MKRKDKRSEEAASASGTNDGSVFADVMSRKMSRRHALGTGGKVAVGAVVAVVAAGGAVAYIATLPPSVVTSTTTATSVSTSTAVSTTTATSVSTSTAVSTTTATITATPTTSSGNVKSFFYTEIGAQTSLQAMGPDPQWAGGAIPMWGGLLWETLWAIDPIAYKSGHLQVIPWLVDSYQMSDDGMTHDITIRKGVKFHKTLREMVADDVVYSLNRVFIYTFPADIIKGAILPAPITPNITSIQKTGTYSLQIKTKVAEATLPQELVFTNCGICDSQVAEANAVKGADGTSDYGFTYMFVKNNDALSGPYEVKSWVPKQRYELSRFADWWGGPANMQPNFDTVVELAVLDDVDARLGLQRGDYDMISDEAPSTWTALKSLSGFTSLNPPQPLSMCLITKGTSGPLADWRVRKALKMAIDYSDINANLMQGTTFWNESLFGNGVPGSEVNAKYFPGADYAGAKALLAQAGYPDGFTLDYFARPAPRYGVSFINVGEALNTHWANIGVSATIKVYEIGTFYEYMQDPKTPGAWLLPGGTPNTPVPVFPDWAFNPGDQKAFLSFTPDLLPNDAGAQAYFKLQDQLLPKALNELVSDKSAAIADFQKLEASFLENGPMIGLIALSILSTQTSKLNNFYPVYDDYAEMVLYGASKSP